MDKRAIEEGVDVWKRRWGCGQRMARKVVQERRGKIMWWDRGKDEDKSNERKMVLASMVEEVKDCEKKKNIGWRFGDGGGDGGRRRGRGRRTERKAW
jgi:hypothetical protein